MVFLAWTLFFLTIMMILSFQRASLIVWTVTLGALLVLLTTLSQTITLVHVLLDIFYLIIFIPLNILPLRRNLLTRHILALYRQVMPKLSDTEHEALKTGTVGWIGDLFSGMPDWEKFKAIPYAKITEEEQAFLDGPVEELCAKVDSWSISRAMTIPQDIWQYLKQQGFFGMIIPKRYGGKGFTAVAHSQVLVKVAGVSTAVGTVIGVPNSLGPAELLLHYGTEEQKDYYLPRLAKGEEIPCFALTSPVAGSDASAITDHGVVCREVFAGKEQICIRLTWNKRYITLAPVATLLGLAFRLYDPDQILGKKKNIGITCALIPTSTAGVIHNRQHYPLDCAFPNGPTQGTDVIIPIEWVIGGQAMVGMGWKMLMECLAAGRSITLPSMTTGGMRRAALASGAYARIRRQFNAYIGRFGGIEEVLTRIGGYAYLAEAIRLFTVSALDHSEIPVVASAISKYHVTELARKVSMAAMDVHGGKGICMGPNNYLAQNHIELPISITVEGANILTRSMIIFGQGAIRCHPYVLSELLAATEENQAKALKKFDKAFFAHAGFLLSNILRSILLGISNGRFVRMTDGPLKRYYQLVSRFSSVLALVADMSMMSIGGALKQKEQLSARLGDLVSVLYMVSTVLKYYEEGSNKEELPVVKWILKDLLFYFQTQLDTFLTNMPLRPVAWILRVLVFPLGKSMKLPTDAMGAKIAKLLLEPSVLRDRLGKNVYLTPNANNPIGQMHHMLSEIIAIEDIERNVMKACRSHQIEGKDFKERVQAAVGANVITAAEGTELLRVDELRMKIIHVDDFPI